MNPELSHIAARCHYQDRLRAAECAQRMPRVRRSSGLGRAIASMRFSRRYRSLAFRTAAVS
jgi:hypothetical protein